MSLVPGGTSGPGRRQRPDPAGTSPATASATTCTARGDSIAPAWRAGVSGRGAVLAGSRRSARTPLRQHAAGICGCPFRKDGLTGPGRSAAGRSDARRDVNRPGRPCAWWRGRSRPACPRGAVCGIATAMEVPKNARATGPPKAARFRFDRGVSGTIWRRVVRGGKRATLQERSDDRRQGRRRRGRTARASIRACRRTARRPTVAAAGRRFHRVLGPDARGPQRWQPGRCGGQTPWAQCAGHRCDGNAGAHWDRRRLHRRHG